VRSEYIFVDDIPHLLEINTVPGMTANSIIPQQLDTMGIELSDFFSYLLQTALKSV
jgi:D-alanine-D-alanine ligase